MNTKKGFTLVEMLVVIGLLAIFGVAIGIALNRNMKQNKVNQEKEFNQKVIGAANLYASNNSDILTSLYEDKGYIIVKVNDIIDAGYIQDNLVNPSTNEKIDGNENILVSLDGGGLISIEYPINDAAKDYLQTQTIKVLLGASLDDICYEGINTNSLIYIKGNGNPLNDYLVKDANIKCNTSSVNPNKSGSYKVKYDYKTENGVWKQATRVVLVEGDNKPNANIPADTLSGKLRLNCSADAPLTMPGREFASTDEGMHQTEDDYGTSCYYRGDVKNNYLMFAGVCWRIVRITGNGDIKIVLSNNGECDESKNWKGAISVGGFNEGYYNYQSGCASMTYNHYSGYNSDIGFMYGDKNASNYNDEHKNINNSKILTALINQYNKLFNSEQEKYIADTIWCNDKRVYSGKGYSTSITEYMAYKRLYGDNIEPSLKCGSSLDDNKISKFTVNDTVYGNGALEKSVGLLTADEITFAGTEWKPYYSSHGTNYLTHAQTATLTPVRFGTYNGNNSCTLSSQPIMFYLQYDRPRWDYSAIWNQAALLTIALKSDTPFVNINASGTVNDPYVVKENE